MRRGTRLTITFAWAFWAIACAILTPVGARALEQVEFEAQLKADWDRLRIHQEQLGLGKTTRSESPEYKLAPQYFQMYLDLRPSKVAEKALETAFRMWGNVSGVTEESKKAIEQIGYSEDVWHIVAPELIRVYQWKGHHDEVWPLLEELEQKVIPKRSRSAILSLLAEHSWNMLEIARARDGFKQIIEWNASPEHVERAKGNLYELDYLTQGKVAPDFETRDIDGQPIRLSEFRGKIVVIDFWATWCGPCLADMPYLKRISSRYATDQVVIIGVTLDDDLEKLRQKIQSDHLDWPHIREGSDFKGKLVRLYNVNGVPKKYILDRNGRIVDKGARKEQLEQAVASLL